MLEAQNTGPKAISAIVYYYTPSGSSKGFTMWQTYSGNLLPGAIATMHVSSDLAVNRLGSQVQIVAVLFSDRTHVGSAKNPATGNDVFADIFQQRQGMADSFAAWDKVVAKFPKDDHQFIQAFVQGANSIEIPDAGEAKDVAK